MRHEGVPARPPVLVRWLVVPRRRSHGSGRTVDGRHNWTRGLTWGGPSCSRWRRSRSVWSLRPAPTTTPVCRSLDPQSLVQLPAPGPDVASRPDTADVLLLERWARRKGGGPTALTSARMPLCRSCCLEVALSSRSDRAVPARPSQRGAPDTVFAADKMTGSIGSIGSKILDLSRWQAPRPTAAITRCHRL